MGESTMMCLVSTPTLLSTLSHRLTPPESPSLDLHPHFCIISLPTTYQIFAAAKSTSFARSAAAGMEAGVIAGVDVRTPRPPPSPPLPASNVPRLVFKCPPRPIPASRAYIHRESELSSVRMV